MSDVADDEDHHLLGKAGRANVLETLNAQGPQGIAEFQEARQSPIFCFHKDDTGCCNILIVDAAI